MPIVLFALLLFNAFAQENCNPLELEKMCFAEICKVSEKNLIFQDPKVLKLEASKSSFTLPKDVSENVDKIISITKKIKNDIKASITESTLKDLAHQALEYPGFGQTFIQNFFADSIKCRVEVGKCEPIVNDMDPYGTKLKALYPKLAEYSEIEIGLDLLIPEQRNEYLQRALEKISPQHDKNFIKAQKALISNNTETSDLPWIQEYKDFVKKDLEQYYPVLLNAITQKSNELLTSEYSKRDISESCRVNEFLKKEMLKAAGPKEFEAITEKASTDFKSLFLPKLSSHSRQVLEKSLGHGLFRPVELDKQSIAPHLNVLVSELKKYQRPNDPGKLLQSLTVLPKKDRLECNLAGLAPKDYFTHTDKKVYVSLYAVANRSKEAITHELGHWLSDFLKQNKLSGESSKTLSKLQDCVRSFYKFPNDALLEEDSADWVSSQVNYTGSLHCDIEKLVINLNGPKVSMYEPTSTDAHSGQLFRELNIRINRGMTIPLKCQELMNTHSDFAPKKCELK